MYCGKIKKTLKILLFLTVVSGLFYFKTANAAVLKIKVCIFDKNAEDNCTEWNGPINFEILGPFNRISQTPASKHFKTAESLPKVLGTSSPSAINLPLTGNTYKFYQIHYISGGPTVFSGKDIFLFRIQDLIHTTFNSRVIDEPCSYSDSVCNGVLTVDDSFIKTVVFIFDVKKEKEKENLSSPVREAVVRQARTVSSPKIVLAAATQKINKETATPQATKKECVYLLEYLKYGRKNNPLEVIKLQSFLKNIEGFKNVDVTRRFDITTLRAVHKFQERYKKDVLEPWALPGSTGYVYITTKKKINEIYCDKDFPLTETQKQEIKEYRALMLKLR